MILVISTINLTRFILLFFKPLILNPTILWLIWKRTCPFVFQINLCMVNTIWFRLYLIRFLCAYDAERRQPLGQLFQNCQPVKFCIICWSNCFITTLLPKHIYIILFAQKVLLVIMHLKCFLGKQNNIYMFRQQSNDKTVRSANNTKTSIQFWTAYKIYSISRYTVLH